MIKDYAKDSANVPEGFKELREGQAKILYIAQKL